MPDPQHPGGIVCIACESTGGDPRRRCVRGLVVHLLDPLDVTDDPERWTGSPWAHAANRDAALAWWQDRAAVITRAPQNHPRFQVCHICTTARMHAGEIPYKLPAPRPPVIIRK